MKLRRNSKKIKTQYKRVIKTIQKNNKAYYNIYIFYS